jgi:hypothetical protein
MVLQLAFEEPEGGPWRAELLTVVVEALLRLGGGRAAGGPGVVLAVDGFGVIELDDERGNVD